VLHEGAMWDWSEYGVELLVRNITTAQQSLAGGWSLRERSTPQSRHACWCWTGNYAGANGNLTIRHGGQADISR